MADAAKKPVKRAAPPPPHPFRKFAREVAIVVLGVLLALGAQQGADYLNTGRKAHEANVRVRRELADNVAYAIERQEVSACIDKRLTQIRALLISHADVSLPDLPIVGGPPTRPYFADEWQAALASGLHARFSNQERAMLPNAFRTAATMSDLQMQEYGAWTQLRTLVGYPRRLDGQTRETLLQTIGLASRLNSTMAVIAPQIIDPAKAIGVAATVRDPDGQLTVSTAADRARMCGDWP